MNRIRARRCVVDGKIVFLDSEGLPDATIAIVNRVFLGEAEFAQLPRLKLIALADQLIDTVEGFVAGPPRNLVEQKE